MNDLPRLRCATPEELDAWLEEHHTDEHGVWLELAKQGNTRSTVTRDAMVPLLLRWGWIDGQVNRVDDQWYRIRITPRRPRSVWSAINVGIAERLIAEGRMMPAGLAQVDAAKADGRWAAAYSASSDLQVPPELQRALDADPVAAAAWQELDRRNRYAMCWRVQTVKRSETKHRHVERFIAMLHAGERLY